MKMTTAVIVIVLLLLQYKLWFAESSVPDVLHLKQELEQEVTRNSKLKQRNLALAAEVKNLKKGLIAVEERARSDLGMIKKDEVFYQIIEPPQSTAKRD